MNANPQDDKSAEIKDEEQIASILKAADTDAALPDAETLATLRAQSTDAFAAGQSAPRRPMWRSTRWLAAVAAAAVVIVGVSLHFWYTPSVSGATLGEVLANAEKADTLHLEFTLGDKKVDFWHTSKPKRSRWDDLDGKYLIADGERYWVVNEGANEARRTTPPAFAKRPVHHFLNLLGIPDAPSSVLKTRPAERIRKGDAEVLVYRADVSLADRKSIRIEAHADAATQRLHWVRAWLVGDKPFAELKVVAFDEPIGAEKFAIADTLTEDGRIGKVTDVQGIVAVKPVLHERWTPVREGLVLRPGDWVRTDARGANATALRLVKQTDVILGPHTLVELVSAKQVRLIEGQIEITPAVGSIELLGPGTQKFTVKAKQFYRVEKQQLAQVAKDPPWLVGFKGATAAANESLGSLVALVDGRNVSLTVGYHKVTVDIRDQIARTVIEESFVNHTDVELEGVFHFPLPADASISGFGMWIGNNLVEADVVEKQRAREIYETILRERRDPGLLEWSGGNIFKARVFPIPARSEKRIKITYTQVLPLKGNRYRYSYALQSELLQQHPLRELSIDVKVNSVAALKSVTSPTHPTRDEKTTHSGHVEFTAQEYTPTRDFEVVVETEGKQADVVMIPHRRSDDGYFLLQLTPPGGDGNWDRPILPNGEPLNLLILADTSASIDASQRATQATFIGALLASLTAKDKFNLAAADVTCDWAFKEPVTADAKNVEAARSFLAKRTSLGWTNLDVAFASVLKQNSPATHVIYVGDGIVTTGDADPVAFTKRLRRTVENQGGTFHAVTLGSSFEAGVMKTIASLGGGSMRKITTEQGPTLVARELLAEIAQPALRDIKVEFKGFKVARVYPETLANVPAGSQQILLGRYLPEGKDQTGEIIVTGTQGGKPVRFSTRASLKDAEQGNSFIPRLWARMHLDALLEQGSSPVIKDEIIALSEDFQIITPYTSLLVLETDADRERFKVKRRFQMRDGERFFADGRDNAMFDLTQKQMKKAGAWRTAMRRTVLSELARLGRDPRVFQPYDRYGRHKFAKLVEDETTPFDWDGPMGGYGGRLGTVPVEDLAALSVTNGEMGGEDGWYLREKDGQDLALRYDDLGDKNEARPMEEAIDGRFEPGMPAPAFGLQPFFREFDSEPAHLARELYDPYNADVLDYKSAGGGLLARGTMPWGRRPYYGQWLNTLFPPLHGAPGKTKEPKSSWPAAARDLAKSLLRNDQLAKLTGGIEIVRTYETFDSRWDNLTARSRRLELTSAQSWLTSSASDGGQTLVSWCDAKEIGIFSKAFQLGRVRASTPADVQPPPLELSDHSLTSLERTHPDFVPMVEKQGKDRALLILKHPSNDVYEMRFLIDTDRHVILSIESRHKGKVTSETKFSDFVERDGTWWAQQIETFNETGKRLSLTKQTVTSLAPDGFDKRMTAELAARANVQLLHLPLPSLANAKKAHAAGKAGFDDQFVLLFHFQQSQQWPRVLDHLQQAEKLAAGKPGLRWVRSAILHEARRHEDVRLRYNADVARLLKDAGPEAYFQVGYLIDQSASVLQVNELLTLLDTVKPLFDKQPPHVRAQQRWLQMRASYLSQAGRTDESLRVQKQLATDYPRDYSVHQNYTQALINAGEYPAAYAWLNKVIVKEMKWYDWEDESLRNNYARFLQQQGRYGDLVDYLATWVAQNPPGRSAYEQYLGALYKVDQIEKADALALAWLKDAQVAGELERPVEARLSAAVQLMLGNGYYLWTNRVEERWQASLGQAALFFARHETQYHTAEQIVGNSAFNRTEEAPRVRKKLAAIVTAEIDKMPAEQVRRLVSWIPYEDADPAIWKKITASLRDRWTNEKKDDVKYTLGQSLVSVLSRQNLPNEPLTFLRLQYQTATDKRRADYASQLFEHLLGLPWTTENEAEAFTVLDKLSGSEDAGTRLFSSVGALHRLTDRMIDNRIAAATQKLEHPEKLTRTELLKKQDEIRRSAREGVADRLRKEAGKHAKPLQNWLVAEGLYLDLVLDRNLKQAMAEAWEYLGAGPPAKNDAEPRIERALDELLRQRYLATLMNLAGRKNAEAGLADRLVKYLDQGIGVDANHYKAAKYRLLIALDRGKDLEQALKQWTREDDPDNRWRVALGYLLAEQGRVPEAIREFEAVESADELTPPMYQSLADWYLVQNQREASERSALAVYKTMPERYLHHLINSKLQPWHNKDGKLPTELDKEVLRMFAVLFDKSVSPQSYLYSLQQFYQASHDFRLLSGLPDAVIGHTAERVYPFVQGMNSVLGEVRDEATADEIVKRISEVRVRAKTDVDKRALDMLEVLVERRAAEVQNQPGPHVQKAFDALVRASKGEWGPGEPRLMSDYLAGLGRITQTKLADEQVRQLKALHAKATPGSIDRLHIAHQYAATLNNYGRGADAIDVLQVALDEFQAANDGVMPVTANNALSSFIVYLEAAVHFARAEKFLLAQLQHPVHAQQRRWLIERLDHTYLHALQNGGEVSIGKELVLYQALNNKVQKDLADNDSLHRYNLISLLCQVYRAGHNKKLAGVTDDLKAFAFKALPPLLKEQTNYHDSIVGVVAGTVHEVVGARDGIAFLLDRIDSEPRWLRYNNQDGWTRHASTLASWRLGAKNLGEIEGRLLKLVLGELRRDLETRESRNRSMYHRHSDLDRFWKEKSADFAKTAEAVLAERSKSGPTALYVADYFYWGLAQPKRAIDILFAAHKQKLLDDEGQAKLIDFLHREKRFAESIAVLQPLVERRPGNLDYRVLLMHAYFKSDRPGDLLALLKATDAYFHEKGRWGEHPMSRLANSTLQNELYEQSVAYFKELIPLHERTHPGRAVGNGTLAGYYIGLANAYAGLKKTPEAVEAASGAIVAWGNDRKQRADALKTLEDVLRRSADLDGFVANFDKQMKDQDSAIVRKALGNVYHDKKEYAKAIKQLELAAALQRNDAEIYQALVLAYDGLGDKEGAVRQLLQAVQLSRRDLKLYQDLGKRYADAKQTAEAERAYTSIVEMQPMESESHTLLAEIREKQNRWPEAIAHWEQVSRIRALEPTGLLKLAAAQIHEKQWDQARQTLRKLDSRTWPPHFGDVHRKVRKLEEKLPLK